jgi:hypothetical protein
LLAGQKNAKHEKLQMSETRQLTILHNAALSTVFDGAAEEKLGLALPLAAGARALAVSRAPTAGTRVDPRVRALLREELAALAPGERPKLLAFLVTPGFDWHSKYLAGLTALGYRTRVDGKNPALLELAKGQ